MKRSTRELKTTVGADGRSYVEAFAVGPDASLDVAEIVLEGADLDGEFVAEIVKHPFFTA